MGYVIPVVLRTNLDYTDLGSGLTGKEATLARAVDVTGGRTLDAVLRIHSKDIVHASSSIKVILRAEAPSAEDPANDYVYKPVTELVEFSITSTSPSGNPPWMVLDKLTDVDAFGGFMRVIVIATQGGTGGSSNLKATISMDFVLRP